MVTFFTQLFCITQRLELSQFAQNHLAFLLNPIFLAIASALTSWYLLKTFIPTLRRRLVDLPNARSAHHLPTPRGGGLAFVITGTVLAPLAGSGAVAFLPLVSTPLAVIGAIDDKYNISPLLRFVFQLLTSVALIYMSPHSLPLWSIPLLLILITAIINFFNFMDGLDGLVALCTLITFLAVVLSSTFDASPMPVPVHYNSSLWPLIGGLIGFLFWNWSPAKIFMGDVGSTFLGAVFAGVVLQQSNLSRVCELLMVPFPLLADAAICVFRRLIAKQPIFLAHRLHLFQRLFQAGWTHSRVAALYGLGTCILAVCFLWGNINIMILMLIIELLIGLWLDQHVAVGFFKSLSDLQPALTVNTNNDSDRGK